MTTFALFLSNENPTNCSVHRILVTVVIKVKLFPELTDVLNSAKPLPDTGINTSSKGKSDKVCTTISF